MLLDEIVENSLTKLEMWNEFKDKLNELPIYLTIYKQQCLCMARAVAANSDIILMDEPTGNFDPISSKKFNDLIVKIKNNCTIVMVSHNYSEIERISDYIAFLDNGSLTKYVRNI